MIASVAVGLGVFDIILDFQYGYIVLSAQHIRNTIYIVYKGADYSYSCHVMNIVEYRVDIHREVLAYKLAHYAFGLFHSAFNHFYGVSVVGNRKLVVKHLKFGAYLFYGTVVHHHNLLKIAEGFQHFGGGYIYRHTFRKYFLKLFFHFLFFLS